MKKLLTILLLVTNFAFGQTHITGTGTSGDPFTFYTAEQLDSIRYLVTTADRYYQLGADIDFTSFGAWTTVSTAFDGKFDGRGYTLSNLTFTKYDAGADEYIGLFATTNFIAGGVDTTVIKNLYVDGVTINDSLTGTGSNYVGTIIGDMRGVRSALKNVHISNVTISIAVPNNEPPRVGGAVGVCNTTSFGSTGYFHFEKVSVTNVSITLRNASAQQAYVGGMLGYASGNTNYDPYVNQCWAIDVEIITVRASDFAGGLIGYFTRGILQDCYVFNGYVQGVAATATFITSGLVVGACSGTFLVAVQRLYGVGDVEITNQADSLDGGLFGGVDDTSKVKGTSVWCIDSTNATYDYSQGFQDPGNLSNGPHGETTAWMKDSTNFQALGWTFNNEIWFMHPAINDGFPNLIEGISFVAPTLTYPDTLYYFREDSVITITWELGTDTSATLQNLYYSTNGGADWILIEDSLSATDTTYLWIIPDAQTTNGKIKIENNGTILSLNSDSTATSFWILTNSYIDFLYPIQVEELSLFAGDTAHVSFESQFVESAFLYWSPDSTTWYFIDTVAVDTANGFFQDTTTYVWTYPPNITGPTIYGRASQNSDTTLYSFSRSYIEHGYGFPHGIFLCQTDSGGAFVYHKYYYDPSCGWASPTKGWDTRLLDDAGTGHTFVHNHFAFPYTGADWIIPEGVYLIDGSDTTYTDLNTFYTYGSTLAYQGRTYYLADSLLLCDDEVNNIDSILVANLEDLFSGSYPWTDGNVAMQLYHVQRSKISGQYLPADTTFENLNDSWFTPRIILGSTTGAYPSTTISIEALPYPNNPDPAIEDEIFYINAKIGRFYFRGIHPKANKEYNINWNTGEYEEEEE